MYVNTWIRKKNQIVNLCSIEKSKKELFCLKIITQNAVTYIEKKGSQFDFLPVTEL